MYILTPDWLRSVQVLREKGNYRVACTVLVDGRSQESLIGPAVGETDCYVLVGGIKRVVDIAVVAVSDAVKAQLEAVAQQANVEASAPEAAAPVEAPKAPPRKSFRLNELTQEEQAARQGAIADAQARLWQKRGERRTPTTGRYAGHHCPKAGR